MFALDRRKTNRETLQLLRVLSPSIKQCKHDQCDLNTFQTIFNIKFSSRHDQVYWLYQRHIIAKTVMAVCMSIRKVLLYI